jgi:hypothetical protein
VLCMYTPYTFRASRGNFDRPNRGLAAARTYSVGTAVEEALGVLSVQCIERRTRTRIKKAQ